MLYYVSYRLCIMAAENMSMSDKLRETHPYNVFYTEVPSSKETAGHINSIKFSDLLCPSLGKVKRSLHITYMLEVEWLMSQYKSRNVGDTPITILFDRFAPDRPQDFKNDDCDDEYDPAIDKYHNITYKKIEMPTYNRKGMKGKHHSRISIFQYDDGSLRIVVLGASLWSADWEHFQNMLWVSPRLRPLQQRSERSGDSPTKFKTTLLTYLDRYTVSMLQDWIDIIEGTDFSSIRVFLVTSVPGKHRASRQLTHQQRILNILSRHCNLPLEHQRKDKSWEIHVSVSGLGYFGDSPDDWMNPIMDILKTTTNSSDDKSDIKIKLIYPSVRNVLEGEGFGLKYEQEMHQKQLWIQDYLYQWKADALDRSKVLSSSKTYCMIEPFEKKMAWFLLTSANFSRNGWGFPGQPTVNVRSYEAGVLFLPKFLKEDYFTVGHLTQSTSKLFPIMYDLPLIPYEEDDHPFVVA